MAKVQLDPKMLQQVANSSSVRAALAARARRVLGVAQTEAYRSGWVNLGDRMGVVSGTRPGSKSGGFRRPYARVEARLSDEELLADKRRAKLTRKQIMRRAARA